MTHGTSTPWIISKYSSDVCKVFINVWRNASTLLSEKKQDIELYV